MTKSDSAETQNSKRAHFATPAPSMISHDDPRQDPAGRRTLYVLGFGIAGAILSNMLVFVYFASFYASG
jgi:hypothetical protein